MAQESNVILITGGSSGLGLEMARQFTGAGHQVIACSRNEDKLKSATQGLPGIITFACDIAVPSERIRLCSWIRASHPGLNCLVNNAAIVHRTDFVQDHESYVQFRAELATNLEAPVHLTHLLFPVLKQNRNARIINITTGLIYAPRNIYPFYNATKSALHAFTQVLRSQLEKEPVKVVEVMFPVVDTPWHKGDPPKIAIRPEKAVYGMMKGLERDRKEIRVGVVRILYYLSRIAPGFAFRKINALR